MRLLVKIALVAALIAAILGRAYAEIITSLINCGGKTVRIEGKIYNENNEEIIITEYYEEGHGKDYDIFEGKKITIKSDISIPSLYNYHHERCIPSDRGSEFVIYVNRLDKLGLIKSYFLKISSKGTKGIIEYDDTGFCIKQANSSGVKITILPFYSSPRSLPSQSKKGPSSGGFSLHGNSGKKGPLARLQEFQL